MPIDATEVVVGSNGKVYVAPAGTALPTNTATALNAAFKDVGYVSEDGVTFNDSKDIEDVSAWQSFYPIRKLITGKNSSVEFVMRQWNEDTVKIAFGGGVIQRTAGITTYRPPKPDDGLDYRAVVIEWVDGVATYRLVIPRCVIDGEVSPNVVRTSAADLGVSFAVTPTGNPDGVTLSLEPWYLVTNATQFQIT